MCTVRITNSRKGAYPGGGRFTLLCGCAAHGVESNMATIERYWLVLFFFLLLDPSPVPVPKPVFRTPLVMAPTAPFLACLATSRIAFPRQIILIGVPSKFNASLIFLSRNR